MGLRFHSGNHHNKIDNVSGWGNVSSLVTKPLLTKLSRGEHRFWRWFVHCDFKNSAVHGDFNITKTRLFKYIENFTTKNWKFSDKHSEAVLTSTHHLCFEKQYKEYQIYFIWKFSFFGGKIFNIFELAYFRNVCFRHLSESHCLLGHLHRRTKFAICRNCLSTKSYILVIGF